MVDSNWESSKATVSIGDLVRVQVTERKPFGLLVAFDGHAGVIERIGLTKDGYSLDEFEVGSTTDATVIGFRDWSKQIELRLPTRVVTNG